MNNSTTGWENLPTYLLYTVQGFIISSSNLLIVFSILRHEALRTSKEYLVMLGLSMADSSSLSGFLAAGVYRIYLLLVGQHNQLRTPWECAIKLHDIILTIGVPWSNIMLAVVSLDRLLCVSMPLNYLGWTIKYAYALLLSAFGAGLINCGSYLLVTYMINEGASKVPAACVTYSVLKDAPSGFSFLIQTIPTFFAFFSVVTYLVVWYKHKKHFSQIAPFAGSAGQSFQEEQLRHQHRVTVSLAISCICTFVLFCIPMVIANVLLSFGLNQTALYFYLLSTINPLCNVFIYQIRHKELRMALKSLFCCKNLPIDIRMWNVNQNASLHP